ncbi:hypothetical protein [Microvirga pakistanensis]|uniref:hypothetical protein n=1 Tax=Microvirga pakistanensis TaxID=1682650 RepID=UPI00106913AD|nr:hypothetical protein [Microvirga pakistanensis]
MTKTVTSLFHSARHADIAAHRLEQAGIPRSGIDIWSTSINLAPLLEDAGVSRADTDAYVEGVLHGGSVVIVSCADDEVGRVVQILDDEGVLDRDEQQASERTEEQEEPASADRPDGAGDRRVRIHSREDDRPAQT